ncbi:MAG: bifunctional riboflavin kinase/FAD synthetase [Clostridia bacterium]|nr:bifunctional riboflavin kinase/FAD synthetase [Clostridia bacterium]MDE7328665.1 bifunctional riboflavin kinase/FAD synthetase [Clostridia bacterium]
MGRWKGIETLNFFDKSGKEIVLALGFFDCLHIGHIKLIEASKLMAFKKSCNSGVFTFSNSPFEVLGKSEKQILNFEERLFKLNALQVDYCIKAEFSREFSQLSPIEFLDTILNNFKVKGIVVGSDYTFGAKGSGNIDVLAKWCLDNKIELRVVDFAKDEGRKISSTQIRELLQSGDLAKANAYLTQPYFVIGEVEHGHKRGSNIGFATANVNYPDDKVKLKAGVYYTRVLLDGVWLKAVTNVGEHPTFDDGNFNIESHILCYNKDIYGKKIIVKFLEKIREIKKFNSKEELAKQITKDIEFALESKL